ncbi:MAG TPA: hypothetical protein VES88_12335 [Gemmatimonadaceae bacterium]|nr:hypothetical protein [Gemmatimonadaceae bacterium]
MPLAAFLPLRSVHRIREAIPHDRVMAFNNYRDLCHAFHDRSFDALILDTHRLDAGYDDLRRCLQKDPIPILAYIDPSPRSVSLLLELLPLGVSQVVLRGFGDTKARLERAIGDLHTVDTGVLFLNALRTQLLRLPFELELALIAIFSSASITSAKALADTAGATRRSIDRWLSAEGLQSASWFLGLARLLKSFPVLMAGGSLTAAARASGLASRRTFERQTLQLAGIPAGELASRLSSDPDGVMRSLVRRSYRSSKG